MELKELIKRHNLRPTSNRLEVLKFYRKAGKAVSHGELDAELGEQFDRITLYRTLKAFEDAGILHKVYDEKGIVRYSMCSHDCDNTQHQDNHIHFHCTSCEATFCIENVEIPQVQIPQNLIVESRYMVINGTCNNCKRA